MEGAAGSNVRWRWSTRNANAEPASLAPEDQFLAILWKVPGPAFGGALGGGCFGVVLGRGGLGLLFYSADRGRYTARAVPIGPVFPARTGSLDGMAADLVDGLQSLQMTTTASHDRHFPATSQAFLRVSRKFFPVERRGA